MLSDPLSRTPYLYARANPFTYTDPTGMSFVSWATNADSLGVSWGKQLWNRGAAVGRQVQQSWNQVQKTWNRVMGDKTSYYPVLRCGRQEYMAVTQRGLWSRIQQGFGGGLMAVGGALNIAGGIGTIAEPGGSEWCGERKPGG